MMKKLVLVLIALVALSSVALAARKDYHQGPSPREAYHLGPCIRSCVQAFNPSRADPGADEFIISDFEQKECVEWCKSPEYKGDCGFWTDDCCHTKYVEYDPDCGELPADSPCTDDIQCATDYCDIVEGETVGICLGVEVETVESAGQIWMDRNLGATRVAESSNDTEAYGDLYQWGRGADGHQIRTSYTTDILSSTDDPGHGDFITTDPYPHDWRAPQNDDLWQGESGINNPCPAGFRVPTQTEWQVEIDSWSAKNSSGAFASPLKLTVAGERLYDGTVVSDDSNGSYWSSTVDGRVASSLSFLSSDSIFAAIMYSVIRGQGCSVRCIKN